MAWLSRLSFAVALVASTLGAQASLTPRGSGMVYDDVQNLTWLHDWNQGAGSSYDNGNSTTDGRMTWTNANDWANNLVYGGFDDWRLPTGDGNQPAGASNEFLSVWNAAGGSPITFQPIFANVVANYYWSSTEYAPNPDSVWAFFFPFYGYPLRNEVNVFFAVAVRSGDVAEVVPEPQTMALVILALGVGWTATRRRQR